MSSIIMQDLCTALNERSIPCRLAGECSSILTFTTEPLSHTLQIIPSTTPTTILAIHHRSQSTKSFSIPGPHDFEELLTWILTLTENDTKIERGSLKPVPKSNATLLSTLRSSAATDFEPFSRVETMVANGHLLDAAVALFTAFGTVPRLDEAEKTSVTFLAEYINSKPGQGIIGPKITRFDGSRFVRGGLDLSGCVTLQHAMCYSDPACQKKADKRRLVPHILVEAGYVDEADEGEFMPALLYDLGKAEDRVALVERVLFLRDCKRAEKAPGKTTRWLGKHETEVRVTRDVLFERTRELTHAYFMRTRAGKTSGLRIESRACDIDITAQEEAAEDEEKAFSELTTLNDEDASENFTPPVPLRWSGLVPGGKNWAEMMEEEDEKLMEEALRNGCEERRDGDDWTTGESEQSADEGDECMDEDDESTGEDASMDDGESTDEDESMDEDDESSDDGDESMDEG